MMDGVNWSIIVAAYNNEKTIKKCIDSILDGMEDYARGGYELIIVDDDARDGTPEILDQYYGNMPFVKIIHKKKNEGLFLSRIDGMRNAQGKYIAFIDSDDTVDRKNWCKSILFAESCQADIMEFQFDYIDKKKNITEKVTPTIKTNQMLKSNDYLIPIIYYEIAEALWHRFYSRAVIDKLLDYLNKYKHLHHDFCEMNCDDQFLAPMIFSLASTYYVSDILNYHYTVNSDTSVQKEYGATLLNQEKKLLHDKKTFKFLIKFFKDNSQVKSIFIKKKRMVYKRLIKNKIKQFLQK